MFHMGKETDSALITFIERRLKELVWRRSNLSRASGVSEAALSNLMKGKVVPEVETVEKIADALGVDRYLMLRLLADDRKIKIPSPAIDEKALYIARRISELPDGKRETVIDMIAPIIDGIYELMDSSADDEITLEEWREFKRIDPEGAQSFLEKQLGANWREIVRDVEEIRVSFDNEGDGGQEPVGVRGNAQ